MKTLVDREDLIFSPSELGCVLYLPGLPGGGSKIYGRSPYGNIGTITGASWKRLPSGLWCLSFDGQDDYVDCVGAASLFPASEISIEAWVYPTIVDASWRTAIGYTSSEVADLFIQVTDKLSFRLQATGTITVGATTAVVNRWYRLVGTYDKNGGANNVKLYVNGVLDDTGTTTGDINYHASKKLTIGVYAGLGAEWFGGRVALVKIYNQVLSALEIQNHFNREKCLFGVWSR